MGPTQIARCQTCQAIVNPAWKTCAACQEPLTSSDIVIESAAPNPRPVYWERTTGEIVGPASPEFLAKVGDGPTARYWVIALFQGLPIWVNSNVLRSKRQFESQARPKVVELIRWP